MARKDNRKKRHTTQEHHALSPEARQMTEQELIGRAQLFLKLGKKVFHLFFHDRIGVTIVLEKL